MGSEQSSQNAPKQDQRAARSLRRGHTIATPSRQDPRHDQSASGNDSPGASMCSDSELPYISYTNRPIGDSPKHSAKPRAESKRPMLQRRQSSGGRPRPTRDIVVVKTGVLRSDVDADVATLQKIPTFLPIMRGTLGLPGARDHDVLEGLDGRPWVRLAARLQAHAAACAQPLAADQAALTARVKETDQTVSKLHAQFVAKQRSNARNAERLSRVREISHQLTRCHSLLNQTLQDIEELNNFLPEDKRLEPFVWNS